MKWVEAVILIMVFFVVVPVVWTGLNMVVAKFNKENK